MQYVVVVYAALKRAVVTVPAHDNRIAAMSFNSLGNRIATASEKVADIFFGRGAAHSMWLGGIVVGELE